MPDRMLAGGAVVLMLAAALVVSQARADLADPTRPALSPSAPTALGELGSPRLNSVRLGADQRVAVIDGRRHVIGDQVAGGRIVAIELSGVRLRRNGADVFLTLSGGHFKEPSSTRKQP